MIKQITLRKNHCHDYSYACTLFHLYVSVDVDLVIHCNLQIVFYIFVLLSLFFRNTIIATSVMYVVLCTNSLLKV